MNINFNPAQSQISSGNQLAPRREASSAAANPATSFEQTSALEQSLKNASQVRPDAVAQASALASDPNYPSDDVLDRLAGLLAQDIQD